MTLNVFIYKIIFYFLFILSRAVMKVDQFICIKIIITCCFPLAPYFQFPVHFLRLIIKSALIIQSKNSCFGQDSRKHLILRTLSVNRRNQFLGTIHAHQRKKSSHSVFKALCNVASIPLSHLNSHFLPLLNMSAMDST